MIFVDTNYFLRLLLNDNQGQHQVAEELLEKGAKGDVELMTSLVVLFEINRVLRSVYKLSKEELIDKLKDILRMNFIMLKERSVLVGAVRIFESTGLNLEDAYDLVYAQENGAREFKSFDQKLLRQWRKMQKLED